MSLVTSQISISLDGYAAGPNQSLDDPLGVGGMGLHQWAFATDSWGEQHGREGGKSGVDADVAKRVMADTGAYVIGRKCSAARRWSVGRELARLVGRGSALPCAGLRADHHEREPLAMDGGTTFTSSATGSKRRSSRRARRPASRTCRWPAARARSTSTSPRGCSTSCS